MEAKEVLRLGEADEMFRKAKKLQGPDEVSCIMSDDDPELNDEGFEEAF